MDSEQNINNDTKKQFINLLPITEKELSVRILERLDLDKLSEWPKYPWPYEHFIFSFKGMNHNERDLLFLSRQKDNNRITLVVDHSNQNCIGYLSLVKIDWNNKIIKNLGLRIHPTWQNKGIGTWFLSKVTKACFDCGIHTLKLDVASSNAQAVRCYEKVGFLITGEFWHKDDLLKGIDINKPRYDFLRPHIRFNSLIPDVRFWCMELRDKK